MILDSELRDIIKRIFEIKAIEIRTSSEFGFAQSRGSPVAIDYTRVFSDSSLRKRVLKQWMRFLESRLGTKPNEGTVIVGMAVAGIVPAYALADAFGCQFAYAELRESVSGHSERGFAGTWSPGMNVIVADDLVLTGQTILRTVEQLRSEGANIICATSISASEFASANKGFQQANITLQSLLKLTDVFDVAYSMGIIGNREMRVVMDWMSQNEVSIY
jgi:orotate phosphoribosyltransferase